MLDFQLVHSVTEIAERSNVPPQSAPQAHGSSPPLPACPTCASSDAAVVFATQAVIYLVCRKCEHVWQTGVPPELMSPDAWTSAAFRISRRLLARRPPN